MREHFLRLRLGIPYVRSIRAGNSNFNFLIANVQGYDWFSKGDDYTYMEGAATAYFLSHIAPGFIVVDVGAHHGFYTLLSASLLHGKGAVFAFESRRANFKIPWQWKDLFLTANRLYIMTFLSLCLAK